MRGRRRYDRVAQSLVGMRLAPSATSSLLPGGEGNPEPQYDRIAGGCRWITASISKFEDARSVGFTWGQEFEIYDLDLVEGSVAHEGAAVVGTSRRRNRWRSFVGKRVTQVDVQWIEDEEESVVLSGRAARIPAPHPPAEHSPIRLSIFVSIPAHGAGAFRSGIPRAPAAVP